MGKGSGLDVNVMDFARSLGLKVANVGKETENKEEIKAEKAPPATDDAEDVTDKLVEAVLKIIIGDEESKQLIKPFALWQYYFVHHHSGLFHDIHLRQHEALPRVACMLRTVLVDYYMLVHFMDSLIWLISHVSGILQSGRTPVSYSSFCETGLAFRALR
eukprot:6185579-Pleurochrysis_carterae.AAC.5